MPLDLVLKLAYAALMCGFARRVAGGLLSQHLGPIGGTQVARLAQALMVAGVVLLLVPYGAIQSPMILGGMAEMPRIVFPFAVILSVFLGATWGFPLYQTRWPFVNLAVSDMIPNNWIETLGAGVNGVIAAAPLAGVFWLYGLPGWILLLPCAFRGVTYHLAAAYTPAWRWMGFEEFAKDQGRWILQPCALNEFYSGALMGLGIWLVMVFA